MVQVHTPHGQGIEIDADVSTIWRFMNFGEFMSLLLKGLFFSSCSNYAKGDDPWEGQIPSELLDFIKKHCPPPYPGNHDRFEDYWETEKQRHFLSCWYLGKNECYAMWRLHGGTETPVAVRSTVERFNGAFAKGGQLKEVKSATTSHIIVGQVRYLSHARWKFNDDPSADPHIVPYFLKRPNFSFEREFRAMIDGESFPDGIWQQVQRLPGINVAIDLQTLIDRVVVGPGQREWFLDVVKDVMTKFGFENVDQIVQASELDDARFPGR